MKTPGFIIYYDDYAPIQCLDDASLGAIFRALFTRSDDNLNEVEQMAFAFISAKIDAQNIHYEQVSEARRKAAEIRKVNATNATNVTNVTNVTTKQNKTKQNKTEQNKTEQNKTKLNYILGADAPTDDLHVFFIDNGSTAEEADNFFYYWQRNEWKQWNGRQIRNVEAASKNWIINSKKYGNGKQTTRREEQIADADAIARGL